METRKKTADELLKEYNLTVEETEAFFEKVLDTITLNEGFISYEVRFTFRRKIKNISIVYL